MGGDGMTWEEFKEVIKNNFDTYLNEYADSYKINKDKSYIEFFIYHEHGCDGILIFKSGKIYGEGCFFLTLDFWVLWGKYCEGLQNEQD